MTKRRYDNYSTEFGLWLRVQPEIDSSLGYVATDIDFFWKNYKTKQFMFIEEKRYMAEPARWQHGIFQQINYAFTGNSDYHGFHLLQFEKTSPDDGKIYLDKKEITKKQLIDFLCFKN